MKSVFALETIDAGTFVVAPGEYHDFPVAEAEKLIACGAAADPDKAIEALAAEIAEGGATAEMEDGEVVDVVELDATADAASAPKGKKK
jgi:hypothetical protein